MIRRVLWKLLLAAVTCVVLFVTCVCVAGYLALRPPSYYSELVARQPRADESESAQQRLEQMRSDFLQWRARSLAIQKSQTVATVENRRDNPKGAEAGYVAEEDVHTVRLSEDEVNALLASDKFDSGEVRDVRIRFDEGQVVVAFTMVTPAGDVVLSAAFIPRPPSGDEARFQVASVRIGQLPLPIATISHWVPKREVRLDGELYLDATGPLPELVLRMGEGENETTRPQSIECTKGEVVVRLTAPTFLED